MTKKAIDVICLNDRHGNLKPLFIVLENGNRLQVTSVEKVTPSATINANTFGLEYVCTIDKRFKKHLYFDRGQWFVKLY